MQPSPKRATSVLLPLIALVSLFSIHAQTARISGRVTDATGAVVPGTSVTVTNVATAAERRIETNAEGYYTAPLLLPGEDRLTNEHKGFKPTLRSDVILQVDKRAEVNFTLEVGAVAERVEVQAAAVQLNTEEGS